MWRNAGGRKTSCVRADYLKGRYRRLGDGRSNSEVSADKILMGYKKRNSWPGTRKKKSTLAKEETNGAVGNDRMGNPEDG